MTPPYIGKGIRAVWGSFVVIIISIVAAWPTMAGNPAGFWADLDIGGVGLSGSATCANGTYSISGSGDDIWNNADAFHYVCQSLSGDGEISIRVASVDNTNPWAKAGVMIRESLNADSTHAMLAVTPGNGTSFQRRVAASGASTDTTPGDGVQAPCWLKLVRAGNTFSGFKSSDGSAWILVGSVDITMATQVFIGFVVTSHDNAQLCQAKLDNVQIFSTPPTTPAITSQPLNVTAADGASAQFSISASGSLPMQCSWQCNGSIIEGATNMMLNMTAVTVAQAGNYRAIVSNSSGSATSSVATLTVAADSTAPTIAGVTNTSSTNVVITFSEPVEASSACSIGNYFLNNSATIASAAFGDNEQTVILTTSILTTGTTYQLTANNVKDRASTPNLIAANTQVSFTVTEKPLIGLLREVYSDSTINNYLDSLTNNAIYPNSPTTSEIWTNGFETPVNTADYYGQRLRGYIQPPLTGSYIFWISSDDNSALYLSTDEQPAQKQLIGSVGTWTGSREWSKEANQQSSSITLQAGKIYYIEALMVEGSGGDNLAVRWQLPNGTMEEPIPATRTLPWGIAFGPPVIDAQPANLAVIEGDEAVFSVTLSSMGPANYQWQKNGVNIPDANGATYTNNAVKLSDNSAQYCCVVSNSKGTVISSNAVLTVTADITRPVLTRAYNIGTTNITVFFNERVDPASALAKANYAVDHSVSVNGVAVGSDNRSVKLIVSTMVWGTNYTVTVNNVKDQAASPNTIVADSQVKFTAVEYVPVDIGNPGVPGQVVSVEGGINVTASGSDLGGNSDQLSYHYQTRTGDFDVKVRVAGLELSDAWAKASLMARETLEPQSRFTAMVTTPSISGSFFEYRDVQSAAAIPTGSFPPNYPDMWLRLKRQGNVFTGYAGYDGETWVQVGTANIALSNEIYVGMAVSSHDSNIATTAQFRNYGAAGGTTVADLSCEYEPLGPSSRKTGLVISEFMYNPPSRADGRVLEYVELFNSNPYPDDISGYRLSGDIDYTFPEGTRLAGGAFLVIARSPADLQSVYGITNVTGPYTNSLRGTGTIRLRDKKSAIFLEVNYSSKPPWPVAADGAGHSLVLSHPSYGEANPKAWSISDQVGGSPGHLEGYRPQPVRSVVINEILAHTDPPLSDYIELYNHSNQAVDLSGCVLSDDAKTNKFTIPAGTTIPARGYVYFEEPQLGFALNAAGETLYFISADHNRVLDAMSFEAQANAVSFGRFPDGGSEYYAMSSRTPGNPNAAPRVHDVVISEIMYNPISGNDDDEFIELYNKGSSAISLTGWKFTSGISYKFPTNAVLQPGGYLVVARNYTNLFGKYSNLNAFNTVGNYSGALANGGERVALAYPDTITSTNQSGIVETNTIYIVADEVTYGTGGRWGQWADGGGSSLELKDARSNHRLASNWADSDESSKASWTNIEITGVLDNGSGNADNLQVTLLGEGECLLDNVELLQSGDTANRVVNSTFESGTANWTMQGNHRPSTLETAGYSSSRSLHVRAGGRGDTGANRLRANLTSALSVGNTATIRAKVRWLRGWPEIVLRLHGNYLEATGRMSIPSNLGTPGATNSTTLANAGPAIVDVHHSPVVPAAGQFVVVSASIQDPDGLGSAVLKYRVDPSTSFTTVAMTDNGSGGDAVAGDGIYSATIPGQSQNALVAFHVQALDSASASTQFPNDSPVRECHVFFGDTTLPGSFGTYRFWLTQSSISTWSARENLSNELIDGTFVYGNSRAIYNVGARYSGSPYHQQFDSPVGSLCHYAFTMPKDDMVLGTANFNKLHAPGNGPFDDLTLQREQTAYWMVRQMKLPWNYKRYVYAFVNGNRRGTLMEDTQVPGADIIDEYFSDDPEGQLYKLQPWFEFDDSTGTYMSFNNVSWCTLNNYTTTGGAKKLARYRYNYLTRAANGTANDYTNVFELADAASAASGSAFVASMERVADMEHWMRTFAIEHAVGNWDSFGNQNAQNMYAYKPRFGRWSLMIWDYNIVLGNSGSNGPQGDDLFQYNGSDGPMGVVYNTPKFRRWYWQAMSEIAEGPMLNANVDPIMDAVYNAFQLNQISVSTPATIKSWIASRRSYLLQQLSSVASVFAITSNNGNNFSTNNSLLTLAGTAPVGVSSLQVNGVEYPITWTSVTAWTMQIPISSGANTLEIRGYDRYGNLCSGASDTITVTCTATLERPQDCLVINEIMYNPMVPDAEYVEIFNQATNTTFDLSGYRLNGVGLTFADGTIIAPQGPAVIAKSALAFASVYGTAISLAGEFSGQLDNGGETLSLIQPGTTPDLDLVIDEVTYNNSNPWPAEADGTGAALQLIDAKQDNNRIGNWSAAGEIPWTHVQVTGAASSSLLYIYLTGAGEVYIDDLTLVAGSNAGVGSNLIGDGDFETALSGSWTISSNHAQTTVTNAPVHGGVASLHLVATSGGSSQSSSVWQTTATLTQGATYTLSFWYRPGTNSCNLTMRFSGSSASSGIYSSTTIQPAVSTPYTPGTANSICQNLPIFPSLWVNEVMPTNVSGIVDANGEHDPWVEIYNSGTNSVSLDGYALTDNYTNLMQWCFPSTTMINPGQFMVVWLDGEPNESTASELHANFRMVPANGSIALTRMQNGAPAVFDYLNYKNVLPNRSYGAYPDGQVKSRQVFYYPTPGATNNPSFPPVNVVINEWMAGNAATLVDGADNQFEDWFELYNAGTNTVDLSGYFLTDNLTNQVKFSIPSGYFIPPGGHLLVWADEDTAQNTSTNQDLHANFKLSLAGEAICLSSPDYQVVDEVVFSQQTNDISQGRWPDGNVSTNYYMFTPTPRAANVIPNVADNIAPVLSAISDQTLAEGANLVVSVSATDADLPAQVLTFSLAAGAPDGMAINPTSGVISWTPTEAQGPGTYSVTVLVRDNGLPQKSDSRSFQVHVNEVNTAPVLANLGSVNVPEGSTTSFTVSASDPDLPTQTLTFSLDTGAPSGASINPTTGLFSWTPTEAQGPGSYTITIRVTDSGNPALCDARSFGVIVTEANQTPLLVQPGNRTITEGTSLTLTASANDPDLPKQNLVFTLDAAPTGATVGASDGEIKWTPSEAQGPGTNQFTLRVTDNGSPALSDTRTFYVFVMESNQPPSLATIADKVIAEGSSLTLSGSASDPDLPSQTLIFSLGAGAPEGATITPQGAFTWTPSEAQGPSTNTITIIVTDNGSPALTDAKSFKVVVQEVNQAPVLQTLTDRTVTEGTVVSLTATATDADLPAQTLIYSLGAGAPEGATITPQGAFTWTPSEAQGPSTNTITIIVTDNGSPGLTDAKSFKVVVQEVNQAPVLQTLTDRTVTEGTVVSLTATATDADLPAQTLTFSLGAGAPEGATITPQGAFTWTPSEAQGPSTNTITIIATDNGSPALTDAKSFKVVVQEVNLAPVLQTLTDRTVTEGTVVSLTATATDADLPAQTLTFSLGAGAPEGATITPQGAFTWTPSEAQGPSTNTITIIATDNGSPALTDAKSFKVVVQEVNQAPVLQTLTDRTVTEGMVVSLTATATDADLPAQTLTFSLGAGALEGATITPQGAFTWTPSEAQGPSTNTITIIVTDNGSPALTDAKSFKVVVQEVNQAPVLQTLTDRTVTEGAVMSLTTTATDADLPAQTLTFSLGAGTPEGATITPQGVFTWTPSEAQGPSTNTITIIVTDNGSPALTDTKSFKVIVQEVNQTPVLQILSDRTVTEGTVVSLTATATDADLPAQTLTFSLGAGAPEGATITPQGVFTWTPSEAQGPSTNTITIIATDNGSPALTDAKSFKVIVQEANVAPTLSVIPNQTNSVGTSVQISIKASDADIPAQVLTYSLEPGAPSGASLNLTNGIFTWKPTVVGTNTITVRVSDNGSPTFSATRSFIVVITGEITPPRIDQISAKNNLVQLKYSAEIGMYYQLQYKNHLSDLEWVNIGSATTATNTTMWMIDSRGINGQGFYRIVQPSKP